MSISPLFRSFRLMASSFLLFAGLVQPAGGAQTVTFLDLGSSVPDDWVVESPSSSMRVVQYRVPGSDGDDAQLVVYFFGAGQGGSVEANVTRWESQFSTPDGGPVEAKVTPLDAAKLPTTLVELQGSYARSVGMGGSAEAKPNRMLLAAIIESPRGNLYAQLHGPAAVVGGAREAFIGFVQAIAPRPSAP
jgi:hypothetical protein